MAAIDKPGSDDELIWQTYAKNVKRRPQKPVAKSAIKKAATEKTLAEKKAKPVAPPSAPKTIANTAPLVAPVLFDRRKERQLRQGDIAVEAKLDLHGMRQNEAYAALDAFIARQIKLERRNLLIITGKGKSPGGVLRDNLSKWLETLYGSASILALRAASPKHGGDGAFYVILKRKNKSA